jgi:hypothetical protein
LAQTDVVTMSYTRRARGLPFEDRNRLVRIAGAPFAVELDD